MFEGPHRIEATLNTLASLFAADRLVTLARELTKQFEEIITLRLADASAWLQADKYRQQGEYVLILLPQDLGNPEENGDSLTGEHDHLLTTLMSALSLKDAVRIAAELSRLPKDKLYARALVLKNIA
jgi:16S rRNA (cytidine1402-2'-O)-methyltransferase